MKFELIGNACGIITGEKGTKILFDPWIYDGAFEGSWCHTEQIKNADSAKLVDAIYISHIHPDHCDEKFLREIDKTTEIIIVKNQYNFLEKHISRMGFSNIKYIDINSYIDFKEFKIYGFGPFSSSIYHDSSFGNVIDSAIVLESNGYICFNANDNNPTEEWAGLISQRFPKIDFALLPYGSAGPYPSCFDNLSPEEKCRERERIISRNLEHVVSICNVLRPRCVIPFAGSYTLAGDLKYRNKFLASPSLREATDFLSQALSDIKVIEMKSGDIFEASDFSLSRPHFPEISKTDEFIKSSNKYLYPYQYDNFPENESLLRDLELAAAQMGIRWARFGISTKTRVIIRVFGSDFEIYPNFKAVRSSDTRTPQLICSMDERLLSRILNKQSHWNNAEIGCHINFDRRSQVYEPDLHVGLQFLHI